VRDPKSTSELLPERSPRVGSRRPSRADFHSVCPILNFRALWRWNSRTSVICGVSDVERVNNLRRYWEQHADSVSIQHLSDRTGTGTNLFTILPKVEGAFRQCEYPFKAMGICWNGDVPLCSAIEERLKVSDGGLQVGNANHESLLEIWHIPSLRQYREAHRTYQPSRAPLCVGCSEVWGQTNAGGRRS
jgi:MoaA/NifB/PqqE/SkfB family radical SAM enzyme